MQTLTSVGKTEQTGRTTRSLAIWINDLKKIAELILPRESELICRMLTGAAISDRSKCIYGVWPFVTGRQYGSRSSGYKFSIERTRQQSAFCLANENAHISQHCAPLFRCPPLLTANMKDKRFVCSTEAGLDSGLL